MNESSPPISPEAFQENPLLMVPILLASLLFFIMIAGSMATWIIIFLRWGRGETVLKMEPWTPRQWGLVDVFLIFAAAVLCQSLFAAIGMATLGIPPETLRSTEGSIPISLATIIGVGNIAAMFLGIGWICLRYQVTPAHVGFTAKRFPKNVGLGILASFAIIPVTYLLMAAVSFGFDNEYKHPLIEEMTKDGGMMTFFLGATTAALIAPITEEFLFRVIIQGGLQTVSFRSLFLNLMGGLPAASQTIDQRGSDSGILDSRAPEDGVSASLENVDDANPYREDLPEPIIDARIVDATTVEESEHAERFSESQGVMAGALVPPLWPAIVTGILFGFAHYGYGLSYIPLSLLGIVLGLLYRATNSIWPSLIVHFVLNSLSMIALGASLIVESLNG